MRGFGIIAGIMMSIMGGYAFFLDMEIFVRLGWMLGVVYILNGLVLTLPTIREKIQAKKKAKEAEKQPEQPSRRKKKKHEPEPEKKDNTNDILGVLSLIVGALIFISGVAKTLSGMALLYVVGSCVMFYGWLPLSKITKALKKEDAEEQTTNKKKSSKKKVLKKKNEEKKEDKKTVIICSVISLALGALAICSNAFEGISPDRLVAYNLVMQGVNGVLLTTNTYKKKTKEKK